MQTSAVFTEQIIIGAEVCTWMLTVFALIDDRVALIIKNNISSIPVAIIVLGVCYVVGLVFDRTASKIFKRFFFKKANAAMRSKYAITKEEEPFLAFEGKYLGHQIARWKLLRATSLNVLPICISLALYLLIRRNLIAIPIAILVCGIVFFFLCLKAYTHAMELYYSYRKRYVTVAAKKGMDE